MLKKIFKNKTTLKLLRKRKEKENNNKPFSFDTKSLKETYEKQKDLLLQYVNKTEDTDADLGVLIEDVIKEKFNLTGGYGDLIANEEKYEEFVRSLGYEYYATYNELSRYYQDTSFQLDEKKLEWYEKHKDTLNYKKAKEPYTAYVQMVSLRSALEDGYTNIPREIDA